jgi:hypothetical protein
LLGTKLIDDGAAFMVGKSFPCIFIDGHGPFENYQLGDAARMGQWLMRHSDSHFEDHADFYSKVLDMIQQEDYHRVLMDFPGIFPERFQTGAWLGNKVLSVIQGADGSNTKLTQPQTARTIPATHAVQSKSCFRGGYYETT